MKVLLVSVMTANAALFFFGGLQHAGFAIGRFHEPRIVPAAYEKKSLVRRKVFVLYYELSSNHR